MTLLLNTHTVLRYWEGDPQLSATAKAVLADPRNVRYVSLASPWEVAVKVSTGKLKLGTPYPGYFPRNMARTGFTYLPTTDDHLAVVAGLPFHHRDPFDRLIVAQALAENVAVVGRDAALDPYGVTRLW
jgi:PIN domain nuclease of toxin-antitoxin system